MAIEINPLLSLFFFRLALRDYSGAGWPNFGFRKVVHTMWQRPILLRDRQGKEKRNER